MSSVHLVASGLHIPNSRNPNRKDDLFIAHHLPVLHARVVERSLWCHAKRMIVPSNSSQACCGRLQHPGAGLPAARLPIYLSK